MTKTLTVILVLFTTITFGQSVEIDTFHLKKSTRFNDLQSDKMYFPIVRSSNKETDALINNDLKNRFTRDQYPNEPIDSALTKWAGDQIVYLDFETTYNQNGILSIIISTEGCGAYCSYWTSYYNYSTVTGKWLNISEVVDTTSEFKSKVYKDKQVQYEEQKDELKKMLNEPESELDQSTYEWVLENYLDCEKNFDLETFVIYPDRLEIIADCYLPNAIKNLTPIIELQYKFPEIEEYLKIKKLVE